MRPWPIMLVCLGLLAGGTAIAQPSGGGKSTPPPPATAQAVRPPADRETTVLNETGIQVRELYVSPTGAEDRGPDRLGNDTLAAGSTFRVRLGRQRACAVDVRAVLIDGSNFDRTNVDICRNARVTLGDPSAPNREAQLVNDTDLAMRELYLYPPGTAEQGPDRLGSDMVSAGATFRLRLGRTRACTFDMRVVFEDDSVQERQRLNICQTPRVAFGDPTIPRRRVVVENGSGQTMRYLYAIPAQGEARGATEWRGDRLGNDVVEDGAKFNMTMRSQSCVIDMKAVYGEDEAEEKRGLNICETPTVRFDGSGVPREPERDVVVMNRHDSDVNQLYVSPSTENEWGTDRLDDEVLSRGAQRSVSLRSGCEVDIRIVFPNGSAEERRKVNICEVSTVTVRPGWTLAGSVDEGTPDREDRAPTQGSVRLRNAGKVPMVEIYTAPASKSGQPAAPRGQDRLGETVLGVGETLDLMPEEGAGCLADLTVVFRDGQEATRPGLDLCAGSEVSLP